MSRTRSLPVSLVVLAGLAPSALADVIDLSVPVPAIDRWMYPFNAASPPGNRATMPTFWPVRDPRFDDRDGEVLLGFDTAAGIPAGFRPAAYHVQASAVHAMVQVDSPDTAFIYDPSIDPAGSYLDAASPGFVSDPDPGRSIELFACGYRGNNAGGQPWGPLTFGENSSFSTTPPPNPAAPWRGTRAVYPVAFDGSGAPIDASINVTRASADGGLFQPASLAVATTTACAPGQPVPDKAVFDFDMNLSTPGAATYLAQGLSIGRVNVLISSLHDSVEFGGGPPLYPRWIGKESTAPGALPASLTMTVAVCAADIATAGSADPQAGPDGYLTGEDFDLFVMAFFTELPDVYNGRKIADVAQAGTGLLGPDGFVTGEDFDMFIQEFFKGCGM